MDLNTIWFLLIGFYLIGYAILDGFDLGVGFLSLFARRPQEKQAYLNAIGPVWDGNEVWIITGGASLFAAFPLVYATVFSGYYIALMLLLVALIARAVAIEYRGKVSSPKWWRFWDWAFGIGSALPMILFGVAFGNVLRGLPIDADGMWAGSFLGLLNPFSILVGLVTGALFVMHGALYLGIKFDPPLSDRLGKWITGAWAAFLGLYLAATAVAVVFYRHLFAGWTGNAWSWILVTALTMALAYLPIAAGRRQYFRGFMASSVVIFSVLGLSGISLYPRIVPSSIDLDYSLTIYNAASSEKGMMAMLVITLIGLPLVLGYTIYVYRVFKGKVKMGEGVY
ncbi:MAG: cytochrome d ubiquinol oxidase subunit II [Candidatus Zixiibacteriota bacterium]|nr:MAG: cytochrome d ubiquinol oxidase subunit II [candidate division Zixibacteria bacterium]